MTTRRIFLTGLGASALASAFPARAQTPYRVIWLSPTRAADGSPFLDELRGGLRELGYAEGRNLLLEPHWGENSAELTARIVSDAVAANPHLIVAQGSTAPLLRKAAKPVPVVFGYSGDAVEAGLVDSLARPGGYMTGISYMALDLVGKRMEMLKEVLPHARRIAVVANPQHPGDQSERHASQAAATVLKLALQYYEARSPEQLMEALAAIEKSRSDAVVMFPVQNVINNRERIAAWSIKNRVPVMSGWAQFAEGGNLMSYGPNLRESSRRLAYYVDRILKGTKPSELPVELPTRVELAVNLKTARALGITIPPTVMVRATRVIE